MTDDLEPQAILAGIRGWVEVETPTHDAAALGRLMDRVRGELAAAGLVVRLLPGRDGYGPHLLAETPGASADEPCVLLLSHLDTVHPVGTLGSSLPFRVEGDRAFGPGIYDMKGGAYLALAALRSLLEGGRPTPLPVRWLLTSDEEVGSPTSRALIEELGQGARHVLVTEPARDGGCCVTARKGTARFKLRYHGRPAHSGSRPQDGRSAIRLLCRDVLALEALSSPQSGVTATVGVVKGGTAFNVVPEHAEAWLDLRLPDEAAAARVLPQVTALAGVREDVRVMVDGGLNRPPFRRTAAVAALYEQARSLAAELGFELGEVATGGGSDGNFLADRLPVLDGLGVDGAGAHTQEEHLLVSSLVPRALLMRRLLETLR